MRWHLPGRAARREAAGLRRNVSVLQKRVNRLLRRIAQLERGIARRNAQIRYDQAYADLLEEFVPHVDIQACRDQMKERRGG